MDKELKVIKEHISIQRLLYASNKDILSYPIYSILDKHSHGQLVGDTSYGKQDITIATKLGGAKQSSEMLSKIYDENNGLKHMMLKFTNDQFPFLEGEIEISIEVID